MHRVPYCHVTHLPRPEVDVRRVQFADQRRVQRRRRGGGERQQLRRRRRREARQHPRHGVHGSIVTV